MTQYHAIDCKLEKLKSGVYELSWIMRSDNASECSKTFFKTKQQLMVMANSPKTLDGLQQFLQNHFRSGEVIT